MTEPPPGADVTNLRLQYTFLIVQRLTMHLIRHGLIIVTVCAIVIFMFHIDTHKLVHIVHLLSL